MTDYSKRRADRGFTLLELLVVVAIIALLTILLAPSFRNAYHAIRAGICGNNLRRIGEAITLFYRGGPAGREVNLTASRWPEELDEYLGEGGVTYCPEGTAGSQMAQSAPISDLVSLYVENRNCDLEFIESAVVRKLSDEQYQQISWGPANMNLPAYEPGADLGVYWYVFEDLAGGGDMDFDIAVRVTENGDGTYTLWCTQLTGAGYTWWLVDKINVDAAGNRSVVVHKNDMDWWTAEAPSPDAEGIVGEGGGTNYGVNGEINNIADDVGKIVALDYPWFAARSDHDWTADSFTGEIPGIPVFARHQGRINVLFTGGAVQLKRPDEINPLFHQDTLWDQ